MNDKKKFTPFIPEPEDTVDTSYCKENSEEYKNIVNNEDAFPYISPLPKYRREHEPPII